VTDGIFHGQKLLHAGGGRVPSSPSGYATGQHGFHAAALCRTARGLGITVTQAAYVSAFLSEDRYVRCVRVLVNNTVTLPYTAGSVGVAALIGSRENAVQSGSWCDAECGPLSWYGVAVQPLRRRRLCPLFHYFTDHFRYTLR